MNAARLQECLQTYRDGLLQSTLPFWLQHAPDEAHGAWRFGLDQDGQVVDHDKPIWLIGRFTWLLSTLGQDPLVRAHVTEAERARWQAEAARGIDFLERHAFAPDGRMYFLVDRQGRPLRMRRYAFSEAFAAMAYGAWAAWSGDAAARARSLALFEAFVDSLQDPRAEAKVDPHTRPQVGLAHPMIVLAVAQALRRAWPDDEEVLERCASHATRAVAQIRRCFLHEELQAVLELATPEGACIDSFEGRTLNPGHAIEAAWFFLEEARWLRGQGSSSSAEADALVEDGCRILDWMWRRGWDEEHGGLHAFVDLHGHPMQELARETKFWWPHNEAVLATLMAWEATGEARYAVWHGLVHDWAHQHFADPTHGEWFGYLRRDGSRLSTLKGGTWKGPFHVPRMQWLGWRICERLQATESSG